MNKPAIERLRDIFTAKDHDLMHAHRLGRALVAEGEREIVARVLAAIDASRRIHPSKAAVIASFIERRWPAFEREADAILEHFAAMALGEGG